MLGEGLGVNTNTYSPSGMTREITFIMHGTLVKDTCDIKRLPEMDTLIGIAIEMLRVTVF
jgi:hypothetical protein